MNECEKYTKEINKIYDELHDKLSKQREQLAEIALKLEALKQKPQESVEEIEARIYLEYDQKLANLKNYLVKKIDAFLAKKSVSGSNNLTGEQVMQEILLPKDN
jgi:regulator of replication initiation timing